MEAQKARNDGCQQQTEWLVQAMQAQLSDASDAQQQRSGWISLSEASTAAHQVCTHLQLLPVSCYVVALLRVSCDGVPECIVAVAVVSQQLSTWKHAKAAANRATAAAAQGIAG
jgi:hypothetical protein